MNRRKIFLRDEVISADYTAVADDLGNRITYRELKDKAEILERHLEERSLLFLLCDHQMETAEFIYEVLYLNMVPILLPEEIDGEMLEHLFTVYRPQYIYCNKSHEIGRGYGHEMELENHVLLKTGEEKCILHPETAMLLSTSGTTGSAKLVKLSYDNLYDNAEYGCFHLQIRPGQKGLSPLPFNYAYGISFCLWHWHCGATVLVTQESIFSRRFQEFYIREKVNNFAATPYTYRILQKIKFWDSEKAAFLNFAISSGAQMEKKEQSSLVSILKNKFWIGYGQTECIGIVIAASFDEHNLKLGTIGRAFDNVKIILENETKEMLIKSKSVCMGYASYRSQLEEGDVNHGLLHTGDVASIDCEGYIYLQGRLKRYVKVLGKRVSLDDIGNYLDNKYENIEFACIGTDDNIVIYHTGPQDGIEEKIRKLLDKNMNIPFKFVSCRYIKELPRNESGKIAYARLKERSHDNTEKVEG